MSVSSGNAPLLFKRQASAWLTSQLFRSDKNAALSKVTPRPPVSLSQILTNLQNLIDSDCPLPSRWQIVMAPAFVSGLWAFPFEFSFIELNVAPLGSWPTCFSTSCYPKDSRASAKLIVLAHAYRVNRRLVSPRDKRYPSIEQTLTEYESGSYLARYGIY